MRTYSGLLILEDLFDYLPASSPNLVNFFYDISHPPIKIIEEDCRTLVGRNTPVNYDLGARIELSTGLPITQARVTSLLAAGVYNTSVRSTQSCMSVGGLCQECYRSTFLNKPLPGVGEVVRIPPTYVYQTDVIASNGTTSTYSLTETSTNYDFALFITEGVVRETGYQINGSTLTLSPVPASNTYMVVQFYKTSAQPFLGYLARSYSGAVLGLKSLDSVGLNVDPSLIQSQISDVKISNAMQELQTLFPLISTNYIRYIETINDPLEKALYLTALYGIYGNVSV